MTKRIRNILITLALAICIAASACLIVACGDDPKGEQVTYTVTVQKDASTPVKDVRVQLRKGSASYPGKTTDENGKAEFKMAADDYDVVLTNVPAGYNCDGLVLKLTKDKHDLTVTLNKSFAYTVKLVDEQGKPYYHDGVLVGICTLAGVCLPPVPLGTDGIALITNGEPGDYHVKITSLPEGASYPQDSEGYYTGKNFSATDTEMTIVISSVNANVQSINSVEPMSEQEKTEYVKKNNVGYTAAAQQYTSYKVTKTLTAGEIAHYSITAEVSGQYRIFRSRSTSDPVSYVYSGTEFIESGDGVGNGILLDILTLEKGKTYYFKAINNRSSAATAEFVVAVPFSSYISQTGKGADLIVTLGKADTNAVVAFIPTEAGTYTAKVQGQTHAVAIASKTLPDEFISEPYSDAEYKLNAEVSAVANARTVKGGTPIYFAITAKASNYPLNLNVTVTKTAESNDTFTYAPVTEELVQFDKPQDKKLVGVPMDGTAKLFYDSSNGYYHYGTVDGPIVVVNITKPLDSSRFAERAKLAYMEQINKGLATYEIMTDNPDGSVDTVNYEIFLRGFIFADYIQQSSPNSQDVTLIIPEHISTETYYAKYVNDDGVYPLTEELKTFLEKFYQANKNGFDAWQFPKNTDPASAWLFPCYYYDNVETDAIAGEYELVSISEKGATYNVGDKYSDDNGETTVAATSVTLTVTANNSFAIADSLIRQYSYNGTWSKNGSVYSFVVPNGDQNADHEAIDLTFNVTFNSQTGTITLAYSFANEGNELTIVLQKTA